MCVFSWDRCAFGHCQHPGTARTVPLETGNVDRQRNVDMMLGKPDQLGVALVPAGLDVNEIARVRNECARLNVPGASIKGERLRAIRNEGHDCRWVKTVHRLIRGSDNDHDWRTTEGDEQLAMVHVPVDVLDHGRDPMRYVQARSEVAVFPGQVGPRSRDHPPIRLESLCSEPGRVDGNVTPRTSGLHCHFWHSFRAGQMARCPNSARIRPRQDATRTVGVARTQETLPTALANDQRDRYYGYIRIGEKLPVPTDDRVSPVTPFTLQHFICGPVRTNVYVLINPETREAAVVDPAPESRTSIERFLASNRASLTTIVLTHRHFDHVGEAGPIAEATGASIAAHASDVDYLSVPQRTRFMPGYVNPAAPVGVPLVDGDVIKLAGTPFVVMHTPGHSGGAICLLHDVSATLFSGDTLFAGTFGRYDLPDSDAPALRSSLIRLAGLPAGTRVLPGHGRETTIGAEGWASDPPLD